ncbi:targeting protein for Xklp2 isoform X2 [Tachyglossus aculeatus]|uniref:targeting protein for Xklp2 isoform X2 n=1 Tax=Tachyglossus aculeatus TaxID=9261 RepID=UPI0018F60A77|nr:targeting protein for Xklp2 isoform X2 [Tachyglossus aculeatus]
MAQREESYTFDAPSAFINFTALDEDGGPHDDTWFDQKDNQENAPLAQPTIRLPTARTPLRMANLPQAIVTPLLKSEDVPHTGKKEAVASRPVLTNICESLEAWRVTAKGVPGPGGQPRRTSKRLSAQKRPERPRCPSGPRPSATPDANHRVPPSKKRKISNSRGKATGSNSQGGKAGEPPLLRKKVVKSTEEQELETRMRMQQEVMEMRRKNEESLKAALAGAGKPVKKTSGHVTKTVDFHFCTDQRVKAPPADSQEPYRETSFTSHLRKHPPSPVQGCKGPTVPKPFNLSRGKKRQLEEAGAGGTGGPGYVPLAQQIEAFQRRTPTRYHLRSKKDNDVVLPTKPSVSKLTQPRTPSFQTKGRLRPPTCKSAAQLEAEELEKLQQYKFKAREVDPRILEGGPILPKKPPVKPPTQPVGFDLEIERRIQEREGKKPAEEEEEEAAAFEFHPRPCPTKILEDVVGVPQKRQLPITVPKSPAFALKNRMRGIARDEDEEEEAPLRARPVPHYGVPFKPTAPEPRGLDVRPFSFDARDRERQLHKERMMEEMRREEEQVPKFKAHPVPAFDTVVLPEKKVKTATQLEPFRLQTDERGAVKAETWKQQLEEDLRQQKEAACFKARPNTIIHQEPFVPKRDSKLATAQDGFELATEKRARERQEFEKQVAELEAQRAQQQEQERQRQEDDRREALAKLRQDTVHKANPIRKYRSVDVKPSDQPLTTPVSPNFSDRFKC